MNGSTPHAFRASGALSQTDELKVSTTSHEGQESAGWHIDSSNVRDISQGSTGEQNCDRCEGFYSVLSFACKMREMRNGDEVNPSDALRQHPLSHDGLNGSRYIEEGNSRGQNGLRWRDPGGILVSKRDAPERLQKDTSDKGEVLPGIDIDCIERCDSMVLASTDFLTPGPLALRKFGSRPFMTVPPHCGDVTFTGCADKNVDQS
jgi:hypothetical protein